MDWTETPPTKPGVYWARIRPSPPILLEVLEPSNYTDSPFEWSSRLVPVEEVERAYFEGAEDGSSNNRHGWQISHARRVVEGEEQI